MLGRLHIKLFGKFLSLFCVLVIFNCFILNLLFPDEIQLPFIKNDGNSLIEYRFEQYPARNTCDSSNSQIPVLVFSCRRAEAIRNHIWKLIDYRPNATQFPIYVSQDCDNSAVTREILKFEESVSFTKFRSNASVGRTAKRFLRQYYYIARHYKLGLDWVFQNPCYEAVIINEDDLDISRDFFSYFSATLPLLKNDTSLWCISAWNDNGQLGNIDEGAHSLLHRSDYFGGLGWMTTRKVWEELSAKWPDAFWDDWMRDSANRKGRQCIRPEISRTGMTRFGAKGASSGKFHEKFTSQVKMFDKRVNFSTVDLGYLERNVYKESFMRKVRKAKTVTLKEFQQMESPRKPLRIFYNSSMFEETAEPLNVMKDLSDGIPRTSYQSVVSIFKKGVRVYLVPDDYFHYF